ncbi:hypothetical protein D0T56_03160 [Dysgonomonas sp. 520]|nr:hypothetical protein [Dysgonomonas sp. 520]
MEKDETSESLYFDYYRHKHNDFAVYNKSVFEDNPFYDTDYECYIQFLTKGIFCFLNVASLRYNYSYKRIVSKLRKMDGKQFEVEFRKSINNSKE